MKGFICMATDRMQWEERQQYQILFFDYGFNIIERIKDSIGKQKPRQKHPVFPQCLNLFLHFGFKHPEINIKPFSASGLASAVPQEPAPTTPMGRLYVIYLFHVSFLTVSDLKKV